MHRLALLLVTALAGCSTTFAPMPWRDDIQRCEQEAARAPRIESNEQYLAAVDRCMESRGWQATKGCRETQFAGSSVFCDYRR